MSEHVEQLAAYHAYEVAPRKNSKVDAAGGLNEVVLTEPLSKDAGMAKYENSESIHSVASGTGDLPTEAELGTLRTVSDKLPWGAFLVAMIELAERFTYYGLSGPFYNYIANPYPGVDGSTGNVITDRNDPNFVAGAINLGTQGAVGLTDFFQFWCYVTPIIGAIVADQYIGRYKAIVYFAFIYLIGLIILFVTSLPFAIHNGASLGGLIAAMIIIGLGTGGIKSNVSTLIAEQYTGTKKTVKTLKSGERVIVDPSVTVQRIYSMFYIMINIGGLSPIATSELERHIDFWPAYLISMLMMFIGLAVVLGGKRAYVTRPPTGSVVPNAFKAMWIGARNGFKMDAAKPSYQAAHGQKYDTSKWNDLFIDEVKRGLIGCKVFVIYPIYWVVYSQMLNNFIAQASEMALHGIPNDLMQNIDPIAIILFIPLLEYFGYPALRKMGIRFKPITRITWGFIMGSASMAYAAGLQRLIYDRPANTVHVAIQTPAYVLIGLSEIFASITGLEYAYTKAPSTMKSFVMSIFLLMNAFGSVLGIALASTSVYEKYMWMYASLAIVTLLAGGLFWVLFNKYNKTEEEMWALEDRGIKAQAAPVAGGGKVDLADVA